jgi:putative copper export protein
LIITGLLLSKQSPDFLGLFQFGDYYSMLLSSKHILVILMIAASLYRSLALGKKDQLTPRQQKTSFLLLISNLTVGLLVLLISGLLSAIS